MTDIEKLRKIAEADYCPPTHRPEDQEYANTVFAALPALLAEVERLRREVDGERDARIVAEGRYHYALLLIDVAERDGDGLAGVAFSAQVPVDLIDGKTDSQIIKLMCSEAFPDNPPLATFEVDEPSDAMIERIKELVPQDQFVADEAIGDELSTSGATEE
jgi:hypothetical protein